MSERIIQAERNVETAIAELRKSVRSSASDTRKLRCVEKEVRVKLLALGCALVSLYLCRRAAKARSVNYAHAGVRYFIDKKWRSSELGTFFGKILFSRPIGRPVSNCRGAADLPVDRELGLVSGFSLTTVLFIARLSAQMPFAQARSTFREFCEWTPSPRATYRMVDSTGPEALIFMLEAPCPEGDGEILVVESDAGGNPTISSQEYEKRRKPKRKKKAIYRQERRAQRKSHQKRPRAKGKKSKNSKAAVIGVVDTLKKSEDGVSGPLNKRTIATHEGHEALFKLLEVEAKKRGYGTKKTIFISDGSEHITRRQQRFFPLAIPCLDWCHAVEYIWSAATALHKEGSKKRKNVAKHLKTQLLAGNVDSVIAYLENKFAQVPQTGPGNKGKRERLAKCINYLKNNRERLRYAELKKEGLPIGSGVVEGTVRNLIRQRLDCSGMRWGLDRCEHVLHLRCVLINGQWDEFERFLEEKSISLPAQPEPARPYDAKPMAS